MKVLRWIIAVPSAVFSWLFFPSLCALFVPDYVSQPPVFEFNTFCAISFFLTPIVSIGLFVLIIPATSKSGIFASVVCYSIICAIGTLLVSFVFAIGGGPNPFWTTAVEFLGTISGGRLAYALIPWKLDLLSTHSPGPEERDLVRTELGVWLWIFRWILAFPLALASWIAFPLISAGLLKLSIGAPPNGISLYSLGFLNPLLSLFILVVVLPSESFPGLLAGIVAYSVLMEIFAGFLIFAPEIDLYPHVSLFIELQRGGLLLALILAIIFLLSRQNRNERERELSSRR
jgi:hypothetical protein